MPTRTLAALLLLSGLLVATTCVPSGPPLGVAVTLNAVPVGMNALLVVPPSDFVVNITVTQTAEPIDPASLRVWATRWGGTGGVELTSAFTVSSAAAVGVVPLELALSPGTWTLTAYVTDTAGRAGLGELSFAVRAFNGAPPIWIFQFIWYDFESDRDAVPGPDFPVDLESFGLGHPSSPALSAAVAAKVKAATLDRVSDAYFAQDPNGIGYDPVAVLLYATNPGPWPSVTRVCVGGEDPSGGATIGSIAYDPKNANRSSVECASIPPTGIFPREILGYQGDAQFQVVFNPLRPATGGTAVGQHPLDPIVLAAGFDPGSAPADQAARYAAIHTAIEVFANVLGSLVAHETGHALGLVPPGHPGGGLYGGGGGTNYLHNLTPAYTVPPENYLMKAGPTFTFSKLAGLGGNPLPYFSPLDLAYLRDRVVLDATVTALLMPPTLASVNPAQIVSSSTQITLLGTSFAATPRVRCVNAGYSYEAIGETWVSEGEMRATVIKSQIPVGVYGVELTNPDGQKTVLPVALVVQ